MKLRNLDMLRACLALMVLIGHARWLLWMPWHEWKTLPHAAYEWALATGFSVFRFGAQAVTVFFALSGFFIHLKAATPGMGMDFSTAEYLKRRARRILPPYYAALILTLLLDAAGRHYFPAVYTSTTGDALIDDSFLRSGYSMQSVVPALLAQPALLGVHFGTNHPLWSIRNEVFYYALYPLFMLAWVRSRWMAYGAGFTLSLSCWIWPFAGSWAGILAGYPFWLTGALLAEFLSVRRHLRRQRLWFWCMLTLSAGSLCLTDSPLAKSLPWLNLPLGMLLGASTIATFEALPARLLQTHAGRLLEWLGLRSYSLYIFHFPVLALLSSALFHSIGSRPTHGWLAAGGTLLALLVGLLGFHLVERRFLSVQRQARLVE